MVQHAETVRKVAELALSDAVEIMLLIALMKEQNTGDANKWLDEAGARDQARSHAFGMQLPSLE